MSIRSFFLLFISKVVEEKPLEGWLDPLLDKGRVNPPVNEHVLR